MAKYLIGCCPGCNAINAAAVRMDFITDADWQETREEFEESGLLVSEIDDSGRVTIDGCADSCKVGLARKASYPAVVFDGYAVYQALSEKAKARTSPENVSDVLDAVADLIRADFKKR